MSDCCVRRWGDTEWHTPQGRRVYVSEHDDPCSVSVVFDDGTTRDLDIILRGRKVVAIKVDGERWTPPRHVDWDGELVE